MDRTNSGIAVFRGEIRPKYIISLFSLFEPRYGPDVELDDNVNWSAKYFHDDSCLRYVAIDPKKRGVQVST